MEFWDSLAEIAGHHLKKGDWVYVTGRVVVDTYVKNEVNQRTAKVSEIWILKLMFRLEFICTSCRESGSQVIGRSSGLC